MERHGNKGAMRHGTGEHAGAALFGGKTMTAKSAPVAGKTGGRVERGHTSLRSKGGASHTSLPGGNPIGTGSGNSSFGHADHHGQGRSGMSGSTDCFSGSGCSPTSSKYMHGGHRVGKR